jgi:hypothetical protein
VGAVLTDDELADFINTVKYCAGAYFKVQHIEMHKNSGKVESIAFPYFKGKVRCLLLVL